MNWRYIKKKLHSKRLISEYSSSNNELMNYKIEEWGNQFGLTDQQKKTLKRIWQER